MKQDPSSPSDFSSSHRGSVLSRALLAGLCLAVTQAGRAEFSGDYVLTPPGPGVYGTRATFDFGHWREIAGAGAPQVDTRQAPQSVGLISIACCNSCNLDFRFYAPMAGTVTFSYTIEGENDGRFHWFHGGLKKVGSDVVEFPLQEGPTITNASQAAMTVSFNVEEGEQFGFNVLAIGHSVVDPMPISNIGRRLVTVSNFEGPGSTPPGPHLEQLALEGDNFRFQFQAKPAHTYTVEYNQGKLSTQWLSLTNFSSDTLGTAVVVDKFSGHDSRFYRVRGEPIR